MSESFYVEGLTVADRKALKRLAKVEGSEQRALRKALRRGLDALSAEAKPAPPAEVLLSDPTPLAKKKAKKTK